MRMVAALVVVLLAWIMLMFAATGSEMEITEAKPPRPSPPPPPPETIELYLKVTPRRAAMARYSGLIEKLRDKLKDKSCFGIPMLRQLPHAQPKYILVRLISVTSQSVRVAINKNQVYVVGYSYSNGTHVLARFFRDIKSGEYKKIFHDAEITKEVNIGIEGTYPKLEGRAGAREDVPLGMGALGGLIDKISNPSESINFRRTEARLLLIAIQMVSEAVRFKYIQNQVYSKIDKNFKPNPKVISLEDNWDKISTAIAGANNETKAFQKNVTVELRSARGRKWVVRSVKDIEKDMGLLNYIPGCKKLSKWLIKQLDDDVPVAAQ